MPSLILNLLISLMLLSVLGCTIDRDKAVDRDKFDFKTGDDTELFFKNVRQSEYALEENEASGFRIFRHRERVQSDSLPLLNLSIVINVLKDEAYLFLEPSKIVSDQETVRIQINPSGEVLELTTQNRDTYLEFATRIYEAMQENSEFNIEIDGTWQPILNEEETRDVFRITTSDYYRLTRIY